LKDRLYDACGADRGMTAPGHSRRYCQVRLLVRYRQYQTLPTESWGADLDRLGRQDKAGAARSPWPGMQAFVCTLALEMAHGWHGEGMCWRHKQKSDRHQSSERQPAYFIVLKDRFGRSKP
jgi:hypothetical protein